MSINHKPKRIQRKRTKGFKLAEATDNPNGVVYVGRGTKWSNPFTIEKTESNVFQVVYRNKSNNLIWSIPLLDKDVAFDNLLEHYRGYMHDYLGKDYISEHLKGKDLACFCPLDSPCHADVLLELANREE